jgi:hypothetical protein
MQYKEAIAAEAAFTDEERGWFGMSLFETGQNVEAITELKRAGCIP